MLFKSCQEDKARKSWGIVTALQNIPWEKSTNKDANIAPLDF